MDYVDYGYTQAGQQHQDSYVWPVVLQVIRTQRLSGRAFDLGCGNGANAHELQRLGFEVTAVDPSPSGIAVARTAYPTVQFEEAVASTELADRFGKFDLVTSIEVIEHCFDPAEFSRAIAALLKPEGIAIISTPYHGYLKNLALSVFGKWDSHMPPSWLGGHIKLFSPATLTAILAEAGLEETQIHRVGRIPPLAKSMIAVSRRRQDTP